MSSEAITTTQVIRRTVLPISTRILLERRRARFSRVSTDERMDRLNSLLPDDLHLGLQGDALRLEDLLLHVLDEPDNVPCRGASEVHDEIAVHLRDLGPADPRSLEARFVDDLPRGHPLRVLEDGAGVAILKRVLSRAGSEDFPDAPFDGIAVAAGKHEDAAGDAGSLGQGQVAVLKLQGLPLAGLDVPLAV